ncbi:MAG: PQQ-binding-like beta-propeller repeat protein [Pararhodobacter sp.]|nr:PQQ-binding-like beta-propeller repeat protein [Pararhodobacter sp.]
MGRGVLLAGLALVAVTGCSREFILPGERVDIRAPWGGSVETENRSLPISLPSQATNAAWTHRQGTPGARPAHPALSAQPQRVWSTPIGQGDARRRTLNTDPVGGDGRVFTLDALARVQATSASSGEVLWSRDVAPEWSRSGTASGGGLALAGGRLYVASAHGLLAALDAATGEVIWRHRFDAPVTGAPAVQGDRVFVSAADSTMWALDTADGRVDWTRRGTESLAVMARGAAPAISGDDVIFPTQAGELIAMRRSNGASRWSSILAGRRVGVARANISAVTGDPVIDGARVYAGNQAGRIAAIDARSGDAIWSAREGTSAPVWPVGGSVFLVSDQNQLMRLDASNGQPIWAQPLPLFATERPRRQATIFPQHGPVLAGGRLWVAAGDGPLRGFDPVSGAMGVELQVPRGAASAPIIMGGTMFVLGRDGQLHAFR